MRIIPRPGIVTLATGLAVIAALCTAVPAASARTVASAAASTVSRSQCNFNISKATCTSTDPTVAYYDRTTGNTSACTFVFTISWGDGHTSTRTVVDPSSGHHMIRNHTYAKHGVYTISVSVKASGTNCTGSPSTHTFTLVRAHPDGADFAKCGKGTCTIAIDHRITQDLITTIDSTPKLQLLGALIAFCNAYTYSGVVRGACSVFAATVAFLATPISAQLKAADMGKGVFIRWSLDIRKIGITPQK